MIIHMYSAGMDEEGRVVIGRPGDAIEVPIGHRSCGAPIGYPCTCENCVTGSEAGAGAGRSRRNSGTYTVGPGAGHGEGDADGDGYHRTDACEDAKFGSGRAERAQRPVPGPGSGFEHTEHTEYC